MKKLNHLLKDKNYIANGKLSLADIVIYFSVTTLIYYGISHTEYEHV